MFQIGNSQNTKYTIWNSFCKSSHMIIVKWPLKFNSGYDYYIINYLNYYRPSNFQLILYSIAIQKGYQNNPIVDESYIQK